MTKEFDEPQWPRLIASEPRQVTEAQEDVANAFSTAKNAIIECERARRCQEYAIQQFEAAIGTLRDLMYLKNS